MNLDAQTLARLRVAAQSFVTKNHHGYLAEAQQCLRERKNPIVVLDLLHDLWHSPFANRPEPKIALNDIGKWLEDRLYREPTVDVQRLELELGWLRRLSVIAEVSARGDRDRLPERGRRDADPVIAFGGRIENIDKRRQMELQRPTAAANMKRALQPEAPPAPTKLPDVFQAEFVNFGEARDARKTARDRIKKGKAPNPRLLALRPTDSRLAALATNLVCSTVETDGFQLPFVEAERHAGASRPFYVGNIEEREGKKVARVIMLSIPRAETNA